MKYRIFRYKEKERPSLFITIFRELLYLIIYFYDSVLGIFINLKNDKNGTKTPIILVPGFFGRTLTWRHMKAALVQAGHPVYIIPLGFQIGNINNKSRLLEKFIDELNLESFYIVAHSMGGLITLNMKEEYRQRAIQIITLATPYHGSKVSYLFPFFPALFQMRPNSKFLQNLKKQYTSITNVKCVFPTLDEFVIPNRSTRMNNKNDMLVPEAGHMNILMGKAGIDCVIRLINEK